MKRRLLVAVIGIALWRAGAGFAAPGDLDPSFGTGGVVTTALGPKSDSIHAVLVEPDGGIVVAGDTIVGTTYDLFVARYLPGGTLDVAFGTGGVVRVQTNPYDDFGYALGRQPDGSLVVAGTACPLTGCDFSVVRLLPDGSLDPSFGTGGKVTTNLGRTDVALAVACQTDGKIIAAGRSGGGGSGTGDDFAVVRYQPDGSLDGSFGTGGVVTVHVGSGQASGQALVIQPDGKIVLGGYAKPGATYDFALLRLDASGALDPSFGIGGVVTTDFAGKSNQGWGLVRQADGKLVLSGYVTSGIQHAFSLARYLDDGTLDPSFGTGGVAYVPPPAGAATQATSVAIQADGKLVAAGSLQPSTMSALWKFAVARFLPSGALDPSFGMGGSVTTLVGNSQSDFAVVALQPDDGKLVVADRALNSGVDYDLALVRYLGTACGNGVLEPGEQCDDGNTQNGDCCSSTCQLTPAAPCADDGNACTDDVCSSTAPVCTHPPGHAGTVCRPAAGPCDVAEICTGTSATCPTNVLVPADTPCADDGNPCTLDVCNGAVPACQHPAGNVGAICRPAAGPCDVAETCTGTSVTCPANGFQPSTSECRPSAGACDPAEFCTGTGASCPADAKSTGICRPAAGPCDVAESCDGVSDACPADALALSSTVCRPAAGECDVAETCTGSTPTCPVDGFAPAESPCADDGNACTRDVCSGSGATCQHPAGNAGATCRAAAGPCDVAEVCDGVATSCPSDALQPSGFTCRPSAGACDVAEVCSGTSTTCPADRKSTAVCRAAAGPCDVAESCDGVMNECPSDAFAPSTQVCRPSAGECDIAETCTGSGAACPADVFRPADAPCTDDGEVCTRDVCSGSGAACQHPAGNAGATCRAAAGPCDVAEVCDGVATSCPSDALQPVGVTCRPSAGACDVAEICTGTSTSCPGDGKSTAVCRAAAGPCDVAESCDGVTNDCPSDAFAPSTQVCRPSAGECDIAETCTGSGAACPADAFRPADAPCTDDGQVCTRDVCSGSEATCQHPAGNAGTVCRPAAGPCDAAETCDGVVTACPADAALPDSDGDSLCDVVDPCTNIGGGRTFVLTNPIPKIVLSRINTDPVVGDDHLTVAGAFILPVGKSFADLDPIADGARIVLTNRLHATEVDVTVAGGVYNGSGTRGWKLTNTGKTWTFTDSTATPANGIVKVIFYDRASTAPRRVELSITGDNGIYPVVGGDEPIDVQVTLGGQPEAAAGLCTESAFVPADCFYNAGRNQLTCKK